MKTLKKKLNAKLKENGGFTLMEMLIVVAIIAILIAIAIPTLNNQLELAREATDVANVRSAYATLATGYLAGSKAGQANSVSISVTQKKAKWQTKPEPKLQTMTDGKMESKSIPAGSGSTLPSKYHVAIAVDGTVTVS